MLLFVFHDFPALSPMMIDQIPITNQVAFQNPEIFYINRLSLFILPFSFFSVTFTHVANDISRISLKMLFFLLVNGSYLNCNSVFR